MADDEDSERLQLNIADPMSEPDRRRRIWAAYLSRGHSRTTFAHALGSTWSVVQSWDVGRSAISLRMLERAREVLGYTLEELCFGRQAGVVPGLASEPVLDRAGLLAVLREMNATQPERAALARHMESPEGRLQDITRTYVHAWIAGWAARGEENALIQAVNAATITRAVATTRGPLDLTREDVSPHEHERVARQVASAAAAPIVKAGTRRGRRGRA